MLHIHQQRDDLLLSSDKTLIQPESVHQFLAEESYWAQGISLAKVKNAIEHSLCLGIYLQEQQIAFGRMITDQSTFAYLCDIYVIKEYRGKDLGKWMMEGFNAMADEFKLRRMLLTTQDAHTFYEQCGFEKVPWPERFMYLPSLKP